MLKNRAAQEIEDAVVAVAIEQPADQVRVANELRSRGLTVSPRRVYDILFKAAAEMIRVIAADPKHLGGETGMIAILHTWGRPLGRRCSCL